MRQRNKSTNDKLWQLHGRDLFAVLFVKKLNKIKLNKIKLKERRSFVLCILASTGL